MPNCRNCTKHFPNWMEVEGKKRNVSTRKFCLECSPFGKHNTCKTLVDRWAGEDKRCPKCKKAKPSTDFYARDGGRPSSYCKRCFNDLCLDRQRDKKKKAVDFFGGKCQLCNYDKYCGALEFHHKNPDEKDPQISFGARLNWEKLKLELEKCVLLCANCHREEHARMNGVLPQWTRASPF